MVRMHDACGSLACGALALAMILPEASAQTVYKCVAKDGKIVYSNSPCLETGSRDASRQGGQPGLNVAALPSMQRGSWRTTHTAEGSAPHQTESCGDPLAIFRQGLTTMVALSGSGCVYQTLTPAPGSVTYVIDCPETTSDGSGSTMLKGRTEINLTFPSTQSYIAVVTKPYQPPVTTRASRSGNCG